MKISRRDFLILTAGFAAGCRSMDGGGRPARREERIVNAGPVDHYALDGVYAKFHGQGFFIVRKGEKLSALSAICTHKYCKLIAEPDRSFYCKCHGSTFDPDGKVTEGPATRNLPEFSAVVNETGDLIVTVPAA